MDLKIAVGENLKVDDGKNQFVDAFNFYIETVRKVGGASNVGARSFTGHSLGGGIAQYMAYATGGKYKTVTFDAVGIAQALPGVNPRDYENTVTDYVNENDFIGLYGTQLGKEIYIRDQGSQGNRERNAYIDAGQRMMLQSMVDAAGKNDLPAGLKWAFGIAAAEVGQVVRNGIDKAALDPHRQSSLLNNEGVIGTPVDTPNLSVAIPAKATGTSSGITYEVIRSATGAAKFIIWDIPYAYGEATAKVSIAIMEGGAEVVTTLGKFAAKSIYNTGTFIGYALYDASSFLGKTWGLIASLNRQAGSIPVRIDPIVLDISGLGITTKSVADGVYYDLDNNGFS